MADERLKLEPELEPTYGEEETSDDAGSGSGLPPLDDNDDDDDLEFGGFDPLQHLTQLFVTEDGKPIVDVLQSICKELSVQNKILYSLVEKHKQKQSGGA
jgi:hypothetical protein